MSKIWKLLLLANLIGVGALTFLFPHLMVGPGKLIPAHQALQADCFACHEAGLGSTQARCTTCHVPGDIGRLSTTGAPIVRAKTSVPFHQQLKTQNCIACHSDHAGIKRPGWQGRFDHSLLQAATRQKCQDCHQAPKDAMHQQIDGNCSQCHQQSRWVPASFDHGKFFVLDRDHDSRCVTCHVRNDYSRYTCYGCHEHTQANIRSEHVDEGIGDFSQCVECHRSGDKHSIRGKGGERQGGERYGGKREKHGERGGEKKRHEGHHDDD